MADRIMLDAGPLGALAHPRPNHQIAEWLKSELAAGVDVLVPEIADYEVRRELLRGNLSRSLRRLDDLEQLLIYVPLETSAMRRAAELWAQVRNLGRPTADPKALDGDVILAAPGGTVPGHCGDREYRPSGAFCPREGLAGAVSRRRSLTTVVLFRGAQARLKPTLGRSNLDLPLSHLSHSSLG